MLKHSLDHITIVLCQTEGSTNIGAVCRAMKTMGITNLKLVNPHYLDELEIKKWALHSYHIFEEAKIYTSLKDAIKNAVLVAGTSRRDGKKRKQFAIMSDELATIAHQYQNQEVAIIFGNEKNGLSEDEMNLCHHLVTIPSSDDYASLNLSHAVQIICYELFKKVSTVKRHKAINQQDIEILSYKTVNHLKQIGIFAIAKERGENDAISFWQNVFARASLNSKEASYIATLFERIEYIKTSIYKQPNNKS